MRAAKVIAMLFCLAAPLLGQGKRLWVLRAPGEMVEYDPTTFAPKQTVKVPPEALRSPQNLLVNHLGQILFASALALPLGEDEPASARKVWLWDGRTASTLVRDVTRTTATAGSNLAVTEAAPMPVLSGDGAHLYWFANQARRLQRDGVDLSTQTTWHAWRTDLAGAGREEIASTAFPDCPCPTGGCEETCPYGETWTPDDGVRQLFLLIHLVTGQTQLFYKASFRYEETAGKWTAVPIDPPVKRMLDATDSNTILEAIPDTSCCGWQNQSNDQARLRIHGKTLTMFDEQATFKNPDYDVSFYTENGKPSPELGYVAVTIAATSEPNQTIQLARAAGQPGGIAAHSQGFVGSAGSRGEARRGLAAARCLSATRPAGGLDQREGDVADRGSSAGGLQPCERGPAEVEHSGRRCGMGVSAVNRRATNAA